MLYKSSKMNFTKLNEVARGIAYLPTIKISELDNAKSFKVTDLRQVKTKSFGNKFVLDLDGINSVFLPDRVTNVLRQNPEELRNLQSAVGSDKLFFYHTEGNNFEFRDSQ